MRFLLRVSENPVTWHVTTVREWRNRLPMTRRFDGDLDRYVALSCDQSYRRLRGSSYTWSSRKG